MSPGSPPSMDSPTSTPCSKELLPMESSRSQLSLLTKKKKQNESCIFRYMLRLVDPIYRKLGFTSRPDDTHLDILLRKKAVSDYLIERETFNLGSHSQVRWACSMGSADCQVNAKEKFNDWMGMVQPDEEKQNP